MILLSELLLLLYLQSHFGLVLGQDGIFLLVRGLLGSVEDAEEKIRVVRILDDRVPVRVVLLWEPARGSIARMGISGGVAIVVVIVTWSTAAWSALHPIKDTYRASKKLVNNNKMPFCATYGEAMISAT